MNYTFEMIITDDNLKEMIAKQCGVPKEAINFCVMASKHASDEHTVTCIIRKQGKVSKENKEAIDILMNGKEKTNEAI